MTGSRAEKIALRILQVGALAIVIAASTYKTFELDRYFVPKELALHLTAFLSLLFAARAFRRSFFSRIDTLLIIYLALGAASAVFATNQWLALRALAISASSVAVFWAARGVREAGFGKPLLKGLALAVAVGAATSLLQAYGVRLDIFSLNRAPGGTLGNRNFVAHLAAFGLPIVLFVAFQADRFSKYLVGALGAAVVVGVLVLTRSRGAWLAFAAAVLMFLFAIVASRPLRRDARTWLRFLGLIVGAGVAVAAVIFVPNSLRWRDENPYLQSFKGVANYQEGSGAGRLVQYRRSLKMTMSNPVLGVGPGNWAVKYPKYAKRRDPSMNNSQPGTTANPWPSSDWVAFVSERGFIAAGILAFVFAVIALQSIRCLMIVQNVRDALAAAALLGTVAATFVAGAFDAVLLLGLPSLIVWAALGVLYSPPRLLAQNDPEAEPVTTNHARRSITLVVVLFIVLVGALRSGAQLYSMGVYENSESRRELERASLIDPGNYRLQLRLARSGKRTQRCKHARAARDLMPSAQAARSAASGCKK